MSENITFKEKFGYGLGDLASNLFWMQFVWFLNYFYTDVFGLAPAVLGTMILVVRIWDSINDPMIGIIADRTNTRWGKFRPYIFWGAIPFAIVGTMTFTTPNFSPGGKLVYAYITYSMMVLIYTVVNIPYSSLMGVVSSDPKVRTSFSQMRFIMAFTGGLIVQAATLPMVAGFGSGDHSVIQAELLGTQKVVVQEVGNGASLLKISALMSDYKKPNSIKKIFGLIDEKDFGQFEKKQTFYVNTQVYFDQQFQYKRSYKKRFEDSVKEFIAQFSESVDDEKIDNFENIEGFNLDVEKHYANSYQKNFKEHIQHYIDDTNKPCEIIDRTKEFSGVRHLISGFDKTSVDLSSLFTEKDFENTQYTIDDLKNATFSVEVINEQKGFQWAIGVFATVAAFLFFVTFATTKERVSPPAQQKTSLQRDLLDLVTNVPWLILFSLGIITLFHVCLRNGAIMYYFKYNVGNERIAPLFMLSGTFANLVSLFIVGWVERTMGKKKGYAAMMLLTALLTFAFYFLPETNIPLLLTVHILINFGFGPTAALVWAMYTDAADYSEWKTGRRATGLVMSACTMAQKFGYTFGGAFGMWILTTIGYQANAVQSARSLAGIKAMVSWYSAIPCLIGFVLILLYPLSEKKLEVIEADLKARRESESADSEQKES
ncbi:MAG: MFS transporter [Planctomycetes bacterium]|nr:MFS transporter [Planctomycetota bacterium]